MSLYLINDHILYAIIHKLITDVYKYNALSVVIKTVEYIINTINPNKITSIDIAGGIYMLLILSSVAILSLYDFHLNLSMVIALTNTIKIDGGIMIKQTHSFVSIYLCICSIIVNINIGDMITILVELITVKKTAL